MAANSEMNAKIVNEDEWLLGMELGNFSCLPMAMNAAVELDILQIIANAGNGVQLSPRKIVSLIPTTNPDHAAISLDRILRVLASHSVLSSSVTIDESGKAERMYGLTPLCKYLIKNNHGVSLAPQVLINQDIVFMKTWHYLKDAVLEGSQPYTKAHGMNVFEHIATDQRINRVINEAMSAHSTILMNKILDTYEGFKEVQELVDVGGGIGSTLNLIVTRYPHITGINFDMPHVVADAPHYPAVRHVAGNMFDSVPNGQTIFMKWILHDWSHNDSVKILKNCHKALPEKGMVIVVDIILPVAAETSPYARQASHLDLMMLAYSPGGKERTEQEFQELGHAAGFEGGVKPICCVNGLWVMEFHKLSSRLACFDSAAKGMVVVCPLDSAFSAPGGSIQPIYVAQCLSTVSAVIRILQFFPTGCLSAGGAGIHASTAGETPFIWISIGLRDLSGHVCFIIQSTSTSGPCTIPYDPPAI